MKSTGALLSDVRRLAMMPGTAVLGITSADVLAVADMEMVSRVLPLVLSVNEEFNVVTVDLPVIPGQAQYRMPARSAGAKLRDVRFLQGGVILPLPRLEIEQLGGWTVGVQGVPQGFWLEAGTINLMPAPVGGALRIRYYAQQSPFVEWDGVAVTADVARVASVQGYYAVARQQDTVGATPAPSAFATPLARRVDIISSRTPYEYLALDAVVTQSTPTPRFTVSTALGVPGPTPNLSPNIQAADVFTAGVGAVVQLPDEAYPLLVLRTAIKLCRQLGDMERADNLEAEYQQLRQDYLRMATPRVDGAPRKVQGYLQQRGFAGPWRW